MKLKINSLIKLMPPTKNIKIGIIGSGFGYYGHYRAFQKLSSCKVIAIVTRKKINLPKLKAEKIVKYSPKLEIKVESGNNNEFKIITLINNQWILPNSFLKNLYTNKAITGKDTNNETDTSPKKIILSEVYITPKKLG